MITCTCGAKGTLYLIFRRGKLNDENVDTGRAIRWRYPGAARHVEHEFLATKFSVPPPRVCFRCYLKGIRKVK